MKFNIRRHIDAPPERAFAVASDFENIADRIRGITKVEMLTDGPVGVGSRFAETRVVFKREAVEEMEVIAFDSPASYALACESCGCAYRFEFRFTPSGSGTEVEVQLDAEPLTFMAKVFSVIFRPLMKLCLKEIRKDLDDLAAAVEGPKASDAAPRTA
jgi:carbon monoxide dehydrogenase subunit G